MGIVKKPNDGALKIAFILAERDDLAELAASTFGLPSIAMWNNGHTERTRRKNMETIALARKLIKYYDGLVPPLVCVVHSAMAFSLLGSTGN